MAYEAKVIADSISRHGHRITSFQVTYPHAVHKDIMTHCAIARNFQSFRAYPPEKVIENIKADPFIPEVFGRRIKGMGQRNEDINDPGALDQNFLRDLWITQVTRSIEMAERFLQMDIAKQQVNFLLQDYTWITGIMTATDWDNFWALRADVEDPNAQPRPEVKKIAQMMKQAFLQSEPREIGFEFGQMSQHLPLVDERRDGDELFNEFGVKDENEIQRKLAQISVGRCARVSYLTHDGRRSLEADLTLADQLSGNGHLSPFDQTARPFNRNEWETIRELQQEIGKTMQLPKYRRDQMALALEYSGKFHGWHPLRKDMPHEDNFGAYLASLQEAPDVPSDQETTGNLYPVLGTLPTISPRD